MISYECIYVGEELKKFVRRLKVANKKSYSKLFSQLGLAHSKQTDLELRYHYDRQLTKGSVYLPGYSQYGEHVTFIKVRDDAFVETFEVCENDKNNLLITLSKMLDLFSEKTILLVCFDVEEFIILNRLTSKLGLKNVAVIFGLSKSSEFVNVVHDQHQEQKIIILNSETLSSDIRTMNKVTLVELNIKALSQIGFYVLKNKFIKLLLANLRMLDERRSI
ncbi:hypothetical protein [Pseudoalteromonas luteoviolacea]|uniref:Uncharacterized protein n=1 Tax=Pseudoalteromonas luteoviolacea S4060-1 TaxID=1365257 RepID=A0A162C7C8_9GAMM|nr:hypothetical protein [Pseudoalteromonas luteoviolacea]KZN63363.1 hypothetical protein N478_03680 [Pseudoalteromonas luteoviolacea S4060-1]